MSDVLDSLDALLYELCRLENLAIAQEAPPVPILSALPSIAARLINWLDAYHPERSSVVKQRLAGLQKKAKEYSQLWHSCLREDVDACDREAMIEAREKYDCDLCGAIEFFKHLRDLVVSTLFAAVSLESAPAQSDSIADNVAAGAGDQDTEAIPYGVAGKQSAPVSPAAAEKLQAIPQLNLENGQWVAGKEAARMEGFGKTSTLGDYRNPSKGGLRSDDGLSGIDKEGRVWRKANRHSHPYYFRLSLKSTPTTL